MVNKALIQAVCFHSGRRGKSHGECGLALLTQYSMRTSSELYQLLVTIGFSHKLALQNEPEWFISMESILLLYWGMSNQKQQIKT